MQASTFAYLRRIATADCRHSPVPLDSDLAPLLNKGDYQSSLFTCNVPDCHGEDD